MIELAQPAPPFQRRFADGNVVLSRIDRWYANLDAEHMTHLTPLACVVGTFAARDCASNHLPITLFLQAPQPRGDRRPRVQAEVAQSPAFWDLTACKCEFLDLTGSPELRLEAVVDLAQRFARIAASLLAADLGVGPRLIADAALRCLSHLRCGDEGRARQIAEVVPRLWRSALHADWDQTGLLEAYRSNMEDAILIEMVELERSAAPLQHKKSRRAQLRRHHAAVRAQRRRVEVSTLYRRDGSECLGSSEIRNELESHWGAIFGRRRSQAEHWDDFLDYTQPAHLDFDWDWEVGHLRKVAAKANDATPGVDGLGCSFLDEVLGIFDSLALAAADWKLRPIVMHRTRTVFIPKAELLADPAGARPTVDAPRPLTHVRLGKVDCTSPQLCAGRGLGPHCFWTPAQLRPASPHRGRQTGLGRRNDRVQHSL